MSFDLGVFFTTRVHTDAEAVRRYVAFCEEEDPDPYIEPSASVAAFLLELTAEWPQIDEWPEETIDDCPWSCAFDISDGHVLMPMRWSAVDTVPARIIALAEKHGLVCVDPQSEKIVTAPWLRSEQAPALNALEKPWWKFWR